MNSMINPLKFVRRLTGNAQLGLLALFSVLFFVASAQAQDDFRLRFVRPAPLRVTVSVNTTNVGVFTNRVSLSSNFTSSVTLSVSNIPAGCGYDLTAYDTNGGVIVTGTSIAITNDVALSLTLKTTNLAQGEYTFYLQGVGVEATNSLPLMVQSCYIWQGTNNAIAQLNASYSWTNNTSWVGGNNPGLTSGNDVFFGDLGGQTNRMPNGLSFTNIQIDQDIAVGSLRFGPGTYENTNIVAISTNISSIDTNLMITNFAYTTNIIGATNALFHHVRINNNKALTVTGGKGFSLLRDYIAEYGNAAGSHPDRKTALMFSGGNGARVVVSNTAANFAILLDGGNQSGDSSLTMTNIGLFSVLANRVGFGEFQLYPNYRGLNLDTNGLGAVPRLFINSVFLARTNVIISYYTNADNYTNDNTRAYGISWLDGESSGNGSGTANQFFLGITNRILADSICFVGANHASGNAGAVKFNPCFGANSSAFFRNTNGSSRIAVFAVSDGGGTNAAGSNMKANIDFATYQDGGTTRNGVIDLAADRFYIARDRSIIAESNTVNYSGNVTFGRGVVDVNTAVLGYQEHQVKLNNDTPQLGYCQGTLIITNGGLFKVNNQLTLGYTADTNDLSVAQQYSTFGRFSVYNSTSIVSRIVVDGGPRNYSSAEDPSHKRQDFISLLGAYMVVSNTIGNAPGQPVETFTSERSTNIWFVALGRTNLICNNLATPGTAASLIRVAGISGVTSLPATIPIISYAGTASPYLQADVSSSNPGTNGYLLNNVAGNSVDLYLTTNQPLVLRWVGGVSTNWDYTTKNWMPVGGGVATNFHIGDVALFDDTTLVTNVWVDGEVVPGQTGAGVTVSNSTRAYTFSGGTIAGTSLLLKSGSGTLSVGATKQGPVNLDNGTLLVLAGGTVGTTIVSSNGVVNCLGTINGGLTSTNIVVVGVGGACLGPVSLQGGYVANSGLIDTAPGGLATYNVLITNNGAMSVSGGQWNLSTNSTFANFGVLTNISGRLNMYGFMFGTGTVADPDGGISGGNNAAFPGADGRLAIAGPNGLLSPGAAPSGSIGTMNVKSRFDIFVGTSGNADNQGYGTYLCEVDKANVQTNDQVAADLWNSVNGRIVMKNINPSLPFANGDVFQVMLNTSGNPVNNQDADALFPSVIEPYMPGPGMVWATADYMPYGRLGVTNLLMKWTGSGSSIWDTNTANWQPGNYADSQGALFDESAASKTVALTNIMVFPAGNYRTTNSDLTFYTTNGSTIVTNYTWTTNQLAIEPGIVVSNSSDYLFTGPGQIAGWCTLLKTGTGTLTFGNMTNIYNGSTIIDQGVVVVPTFTNGGTASPLGTPSTFPRAPKAAERLVLGDATLRFTGDTMVSDRGMTVSSPNSTFDVSNSVSTLFLSGPIVGFGQLNKVGAGALVLRSSGSTVTNIVVKQGTLGLNPSTAGQSPGGNGHIIVAGGALSFSNNCVITNLINLVSNTVMDNTNTTVLGGSWIGAGNATITNIAASIFAWNRDMTNYTGDLTLLGATFRFGNSTNETRARGSAATVFNLASAGTRLDTLNGGDTNGTVTYELGGLAGVAGTVLAGRSSNNPAILNKDTTFSIGGKGGNYTFAGSITNGSDAGSAALVSVVKVGGGTLALNGVNAYTGGTTVSNGALGGSGSIMGTLTVASGGTIAPGNSVGTFTVSNNATLGGTALMELSGTTSDLLRATGTITGGGVLTVTNIGPTLTNGTVFTLFNQAVTGFTVTNLPAPYQWTVNLGVNGTITVLTNGIVPGGSVNPNPTNITFAVAGNTLTLSWPADHLGWVLQTQTNATSVGLTLATNTWFNVPGSAATTSTNVSIDSTKPTVFYRLVLP